MITLASKITEVIPGTIGIAHTRWAAHGAPTEANAHPHADMSERTWLVHNGSIENHHELIRDASRSLLSDTQAWCITAENKMFQPVFVYDSHLTPHILIHLWGLRTE